MKPTELLEEGHERKQDMKKRTDPQGSKNKFKKKKE